MSGCRFVNSSENKNELKRLNNTQLRQYNDIEIVKMKMIYMPYYVMWSKRLWLWKSITINWHIHELILAFVRFNSTNEKPPKHLFCTWNHFIRISFSLFIFIYFYIYELMTIAPLSSSAVIIVWQKQQKPLFLFSLPFYLTLHFMACIVSVLRLKCLHCVNSLFNTRMKSNRCWAQVKCNSKYNKKMIKRKNTVKNVVNSSFSGSRLKIYVNILHWKIFNVFRCGVTTNDEMLRMHINFSNKKQLERNSISDISSFVSSVNSITRIYTQFVSFVSLHISIQHGIRSFETLGKLTLELQSNWSLFIVLFGKIFGNFPISVD